MNRGTVMEVDGKWAVVLTPDGEFVRIKALPGMQTGDETSWTEKNRPAGVRFSDWAGSRRIASLAGAAVLIVLCFALWSMRTPPVVAYVSMDINPSVEFGLDARERVRELRALNEDAVPYVENIAYKGQPVEKVTEQLAAKLAASRILDPAGSEIVIASVRLKTVNEAWEKQVTAKIEAALERIGASETGQTGGKTSGLEIEKVYLPVEVRDEAKANGISSGKMAFWLAAESAGHDVTIEELKKESVKKIASSWGGLKKVLDDSRIRMEDKESWKKLLEIQKKHKMKPDDRPGRPANPESSGKPKETDKEKSDGKPENKNEKEGRGPENDSNGGDRSKYGKDTAEGKDKEQGKRNGEDAGDGKHKDSGKDDEDSRTASGGKIVRQGDGKHKPKEDRKNREDRGSDNRNEGGHGNHGSGRDKNRGEGSRGIFSGGSRD